MACAHVADHVACAGAELYEAHLSDATSENPRIGTLDLPPRVERDRYFQELSYLELSALFAGPIKPSTLARWADVAPPGAIGLVAPFPLTHRTPPPGQNLWPHDAATGDFRDSTAGRDALGTLRDAVSQLGASCVVFRAPDVFSPSSANREQLRRFFTEIAPAEALAGAERVWLPGGLWEVRTAVKLARELGVTCAFDPLVRVPGEPAEALYDLGLARLYLQLTGAGRNAPLRAEQLDDLAALLEAYPGVPATIVFASPARWLDARNLKKLYAR